MYVGAAGVIWAFDYLRRKGATKREFDFKPTVPLLMERTQAEMSSMGDYGRTGSLLFGDLGTALVAMRLAPSASLVETIGARVMANFDLPVRELMWGTAGSMLACIFMAELTGEERWRDLFASQAVRILDELTDTENGPMLPGPVWSAQPMAWSRAWIRRQHDPFDARLGLALR